MRDALREAVDLLGVDVDPGHVEALFREPEPEREADVAETEHDDLAMGRDALLPELVIVDDAHRALRGVRQNHLAEEAPLATAALAQLVRQRLQDLAEGPR